MKLGSLLALLPGLFLTASAAADIEEGKTLVQANCHSCHGQEIYTREDRKVQTLPGLRKQVQRCEQARGLSWLDDQVDSVTNYLNDSFYRFK